MKITSLCLIRTIPILLAIVMILGCESEERNDQAFVYDKAEFPGATPWTSENFNNNPKNFKLPSLATGAAAPTRKELLTELLSSSTGYDLNSS